MPELVPSPVTAESAPRLDPKPVEISAKPAEASGKEPKGGQQYYELEQPRPMPEPEPAKKP